jgi:hypothetical protein
MVTSSGLTVVITKRARLWLSGGAIDIDGLRRRTAAARPHSTKASSTDQHHLAMVGVY